MSSNLTSRSDRISRRLTVHSYGSANRSENGSTDLLSSELDRFQVGKSGTTKGASQSNRSTCNPRSQVAQLSPSQTHKSPIHKSQTHKSQWRHLFGLTSSRVDLQADGRSSQSVGDDFNSAHHLGDLSGNSQSTWRGSLDDGSYQDMFRFDLSQRSKVRLSLHQTGGNTDLRLFRENGSEVSLSQRQGELRGRLAAGTYFAEVSATTGTPNYTLRLRGSGRSNDPGASASRALDAGSLDGMTRLYRGNVSKRDRTDLYRFDLSETSSVNLTLRNLKREATLTLFDSNGIAIGDAIDADRTGKNVNQFLTAGTYFVEVTAIDSGKARYTLQLSTIDRATPINGIDNPINPIDPNPLPFNDPGNNLSTAETQRSATFTRQEQVGWADWSDVYSFNLNQSGNFTADLTGLTGDADVRLIQDRNHNGAIDRGEVLAWQWERGRDSESIGKFLMPGNYFLQVMSNNSETANYTLSTNLNAGGVDSRKFSIQLNYTSGLDQIGNAMRNSLNNAASFWESVIPYSSFNGKHTLNIDVVGTEPTDNWYAVARSTAGAIDAKGQWMPTQGTVRVNTRYSNLFNENPEYFSEVLIHEFAHVLGIGTLWEKSGRNLIDRTSSTYNANTYAGWAYGEISGKGLPTAVPVEPGIFGHWDEVKLEDEMLTPQATRVGIKMPLSQVTIASLRDIGWNVNYGGADHFLMARALMPDRSMHGSGSDRSRTVPTSFSTDLGLPIRCGCPYHLAQVEASLTLPILGSSKLSDLVT